ncbi:MAG: PadR family transcriptional regulator [Gemmatimonadota bacterium]|nr:PadR family transcriptional regulator [Gemmatimonadota bacterium]
MPKGRYLGEFELYVLLAIEYLGDDAYGVTIRRRIEERTGRSVSIGSVYATGRRLVDKGLLSTEISAPRPVRGGRARKIFSLTRSGTAALRHSTNMLSRMAEDLDLDVEIPSGETGELAG